MAIINQVGNALTGSTGTGLFVGASSPTITTPRIAQINDTNGIAELAFTTTASAVNYFTITNATTGNPPTLSVAGSDTNVAMILQGKGTGGIVIVSDNTTTPFSIQSGTSHQHATSFVFSDTSATRSVVWPDESFTVPTQTQVAKAWVNFTGTGAVTINASYNTTSITDNGTGNYTWNIDTDFSSAEWTPCVSHQDNGAALVSSLVSSGGQAAGTLTVITANSTVIPTDAPRVYLAGFGPQ